MIYNLSLIFTFGGLIFFTLLSINMGISIYWSFLIGVASFIIILALFVLLIIILLPAIGKKYAKTYNPQEEKRWRFMHDVAKFSLFWLGVKPQVYGVDKIPTDQPIVIYCNHQSYLDMFILYRVLKKFPHATVYKEIINSYPLVSGMAQALGGIALQRDNDRQAAEAIIKVIKEVKKGVNFLIFPEGTRTKNTQIGEYKAGSFKIVQKCNCNMIAIVIDGSYRLKMSIPFIPTKIYVNILEIISSENLKDLTTHEIAKTIHEKASQHLTWARKKYHYLKVPKRYIKK